MTFEKKVINIISEGISIESPTPFLDLSRKLDCTEEMLIKAIKKLKEEGKIKRFGAVVKNRSIGFVHNAMVTLDVPSDQVDYFGEKISHYPFIKLCYQRERVANVWDYNLYFMVHGKERTLVLKQIEQVLKENQLEHCRHEILFSKQCLKQKGASY
ncbi:MAG: hypothetical protein KBD76_09845 [Bacteriovorax sp.]|nr:hypothetical protein [Bacteriovorax sp.]